MNRRDLLLHTGAAVLGLSPFVRGWTARAGAPRRRLLMYTRSEGYEHDVVRRKGDQLSLAEQIVTDLGARHGFEVRCEKDGRVFVNDDLNQYDAFVFESQGDLGKEQSRDGQPPVPPAGKKALLQAIANGKGFVGCHCASDTYHSLPNDPSARSRNQEPSQIDPYIAMLGGEFVRHGPQQRAWMKVVDPKFPGLNGINDFGLFEEWYAMKNFAPDLHVILVQETEGMKGPEYQRPHFPATWARMHEKGRVFYTSMGHREEVWKSSIFQNLLLGGLAWAVGNVNADLTPNLQQVTPKAGEMPPLPTKK
jgi:hypothetical protein